VAEYQGTAGVPPAQPGTAGFQPALVQSYVFGSYIDEVLCMVKPDGQRYWYSTNDLYSVQALTDGTGTVVERYMFDPYGKVTVLDGNGTPRTVNESLYGNPWTFTGRRLDQETGLMYFRNRMYSTELGRFVGRDPIGYRGGLSLYDLGGSVTGTIDPLGLEACCLANLVCNQIKGIRDLMCKADSGCELGKIEKGMLEALKKLNATRAVHCCVEWCRWVTDKSECADASKWQYTELIGIDAGGTGGRVGRGEAPGSGLGAILNLFGFKKIDSEGKVYQIVIREGRCTRGYTEDTGPNTVDKTLNPAECSCYEKKAKEYGAEGARRGAPGTGGRGDSNVGLGGPAYKPEQNSNTYISWLLKSCGNKEAAPEGGVGWDTKPHFPFSSDADAPPMDGQ